MRLRFVPAIVAISVMPAALAAQGAGRPLGIEEFIRLDRASDPQVSPDGRWIAYTVTRTDMAANGRTSDLWLVATDGGTPRRVSDVRLGGTNPRWSPDGRTIAYVTTRGGSPHVRLFTVSTGRSRRIAALVNGASGVVWSPTGTHVAFVSAVYPECRDDACNRQRAREVATRPSDARIYDQLLYRHWNVWDDGLRSHLFVVGLAGGSPVDVTAGLDANVPPQPFGGASDYAFSGDGRYVFYTTKLASDRAWSTNTDIYRVPVGGGDAVNFTEGMLGAEQHPAPSADGRYLAFLSQERAGFESDRVRLMVKDLRTGDVREVSRGFDRWVGEYLWLPADQGFVVVAQDRQRDAVYRMDLSGQTQEILRWGNTSQVSMDTAGVTLSFINDAINRPGQVYTWQRGGTAEPRRLTELNEAVLKDVVLHPAEEINWVGADGTTVWGMVVRPPQFERGRRYPLVVLIHGGPQGAWLDSWHWRWNAQMFAAGGYVTALLNPRGSTGFGQRFVDQISHDWGGKVFIDIMAGVEHAARLPYVDSTRIGAAGGSYGGYMINWINGHTDRFRALITHAGVYDLESEYGATDELWFPEWEFAGPPWQNRTYYEQWSPHRFAGNFRTPTLVITGALDFRVPDTQGLETFTALRRQGVPARLVYFPDEGHWVGKPQNQKLWWTEVQSWFAKYLRGAVTP